jgi:hypothetical protein
MLGFGLGLNKARRVGGYTPSAEVAAYLAKLTTEGFALPSVANQQLLDTFVAALKSAGAWDSLDVIQMWAQDSNSVNAGRVNLKSPSDTLATLYNAVAFTNKVGIAGDGASAYVDTGFNPTTYGGNYASGYNFNAVWVTSTGTSFSSLMGEAIASTFRVTNTNSTSHRIHSGNTGSIDMSGTGWVAVNKKTTTTASAFKDTTETAITGMLNYFPDDNRVLFRTQTSYNDSGIAIYMAGADMTALNTAIRTAVSNYITGVAAL